jgi:hypothetical protein
LIKGFNKRLPNHKDTPGVFFLGATIMSEKMRQHEKAATLLRTAINPLPDHTIAAEVKAYLAILDVVAAKPNPQIRPVVLSALWGDVLCLNASRPPSR